MKTRNGFVSNSSSSSFVCEICGGAESTYDGGLSDVDMTVCGHGHLFHNDCCEAHNLREKLQVWADGDDDLHTVEDWINTINRNDMNGTDLEHIQSTFHALVAKSKEELTEDHLLSLLNLAIETTPPQEDSEYDMETSDMVDSIKRILQDFVLAKHCPICTLEYINEPLLINFLLLKTGMSKQEVEQELRMLFKTDREAWFTVMAELAKKEHP